MIRLPIHIFMMKQIDSIKMKGKTYHTVFNSSKNLFFFIWVSVFDENY